MKLLELFAAADNAVLLLEDQPNAWYDLDGPYNFDFAEGSDSFVVTVNEDQVYFDGQQEVELKAGAARAWVYFALGEQPVQRTFVFSMERPLNEGDLT